MGKAITQSEYDRATAQLKGCKVKSCPNAGAPRDAAGSDFCSGCKSAHKVARGFERTK